MPLLLEETSLHWTGHVCRCPAEPRWTSPELQASAELRNQWLILRCRSESYGMNGMNGHQISHDIGDHLWNRSKMVQVSRSPSPKFPLRSRQNVTHERKEVFFQSCLGKAVPLWGIFMNFCYPLPTMAMGSSPKGNSPTNCTWVFNCQVLSPLKSWISEDFGPFHFSDAPGTSYQVIAFNCLRTQHKSAQMQPSCTPQGSTPSAFLHGGFIQGT